MGLIYQSTNKWLTLLLPINFFVRYHATITLQTAKKLLHVSHMYLVISLYFRIF